jgi:beta-phosphoglucomutase
MLSCGIFDVDGVLLASPHERAWREALAGIADPEAFTTAIYQAEVAGKPRLDGARAALVALGVPDADHQAMAYAETKQARLEVLIHAGAVTAFPDALRFVEALHALGVARLGDAAPLHAVCADLVVTSLDEVALDDLAAGRLRLRSA